MARDEAVELKLRVADLESELMEERTSKAKSQASNLEALKA